MQTNNPTTRAGERGAVILSTEGPAETAETARMGDQELRRAQMESIRRDETRREAAHARATRPGIQTSEGILTMLVIVGSLAMPLATLQGLFEQLADLHPAAPALAAIGTVLGALAVAAKAVGSYAQSRAAVKTGLRLMALALVVGAGLSTSPASAADRALWEPDMPARALTAPPSLGEIVDLGVGPSADLLAGRWSLGVSVLGTVALVQPRPGWMLSAAAGGALLAPLQGGLPSGVAKLGALVQFPGVRTGIKSSMGAGVSYVAANDSGLRDVFGFWVALVFHAPG